ncbi:hypothetical protein AO385_0446 [Moraxella catarrhalis]|uniref:Uncharacterized protein n=1 Tax=Moraxella catarrhalis TaxID=480 RepID=A0A198UHE8_MORCA|nr:hypothetical protein AO383_2003 [Moraxella catarrhalis]OAU95729.1 hypothetical protein AO384_1335 [Moraxella catarrhalis]OAV03550.1 hypothetical protein AO385_0446 [Moraxella catarrhalis]
MHDKVMTVFRILTILSFFTLSKVVYHNYNDIIPDNAILGMAVYVLVLCLIIALSNFWIGKVYDEFTHKS